MDLEATDEFKASTIVFKFIAFKTSDRLSSNLVPRKM